MSETSTPTPGPWIASGMSVYRADTLVRRPAAIAVCGGNGRLVVERKANARLCAAAHDLLAALTISPCPTSDTGETAAECIGRGECSCESGAAITKATGEGT